MRNEKAGDDTPQTKPVENKGPVRTTGKSVAAGADTMRLKEVFPKTEKLFRPPPKLTDILPDCIYVLDTSLLLSPFDGGSETLDAVATILKRLVREDRMRIPAQAMREYVDRRSTKVAEIYSDLVRKRDEQINIPPVDVRMLQVASKHSELVANREAVVVALVEYKKTLHKIINEFREWTWSDPVTHLYNEVFKADHVIKPTETDDELRTDFHRRCEKLIPPGYQDAGKQDGIGDLIIWKSILAFGKQAKRNIVFVTNERKPDWWARSESLAGNQFHPIAVRFELANEYYDATGMDFNLIDFAKFLEVNKATPEAVVEAEHAMRVAQEKLDEERHAIMQSSMRRQQFMQEHSRLIELACQLIPELEQHKAIIEDQRHDHSYSIQIKSLLQEFKREIGRYLAKGGYADATATTQASLAKIESIISETEDFPNWPPMSEERHAARIYAHHAIILEAIFNCERLIRTLAS